MIKKVRLHNWKSHKDSEFEFKKGTNVLTGIIGAGKSTVVEAMCYALYGTFPALNSKTVSLEEIIMNKPNQMEESRVELEFEYADKDYLVQRTVFSGKNANQAKMFEEGRLIAGPKPTEVTERVEKIIEMNYDLFSRAVYSEQNQIDFFLKLTPANRKKKFDEILGLDKYEKARKTNTTVINRIKKNVEDRKELIKKSSETIDENALKELQQKKEEKEKKEKELKEKIEKGKKELEDKKKEIEELEKKEKKFNELKEKGIQLESKISETEKKFSEKESELKATEEEEKEKQNELKKEKEELEEKRKELSSVQAEIKSQQEKKEYLEKEISRKKNMFPEGIDSEEKVKEKIEYIENEIRKLKKEKEELEKKTESGEEKAAELEKGISLNESRVQELEENIKKLSKIESDCPVCSTKLSKEKKIELINSSEKEQSRLGIINKGLSEEEEKIRKEVEKGKEQGKEIEEKAKKEEEEKNKVKFLKEKFREIKETEKEIKICSEKLEEAKKSEDKVKEKFSEEKIKELEKEIKKTEEIIELQKEFLKCGKWKKEFEKVLEEKKVLDYKEGSFGEKKEKVVSINALVESLEKEKENNLELIESVKANIEKIKQEKEKIGELKGTVEKQEKSLEKLALFNNALSSTQSELRAEMIHTINTAMDDVWNRIYPYKDFTSAKMEIEEGNYEIKVKEKNGKWTRVEGILSGGERSSAAICIRVAFSLVLSQNLSWLILDEPTHNLDRNSVAELSKMMKEHLPSLVEQIFIITHDPEMEKAASGTYYEIERDKENEGSSIPKNNLN